MKILIKLKQALYKQFIENYVEWHGIVSPSKHYMIRGGGKLPEIYQMRNDLYSRYKGKRWKNKVKNMSDNQVIAIWYSMKEREQKKKKNEVKKDPPAEQLKLF